MNKTPLEHLQTYDNSLIGTYHILTQMNDRNILKI